METIEYYHVPADKIGLVLCYMNPNGWLFDSGHHMAGDNIERHYVSATSRDWDGDKPVFTLREYEARGAVSRLVSITSDNLLKANNTVVEVKSYEVLKKKLMIR